VQILRTWSGKFVDLANMGGWIEENGNNHFRNVPRGHLRSSPERWEASAACGQAGQSRPKARCSC